MTFFFAAAVSLVLVVVGAGAPVSGAADPARDRVCLTGSCSSGALIDGAAIRFDLARVFVCVPSSSWAELDAVDAGFARVLVFLTLTSSFV